MRCVLLSIAVLVSATRVSAAQTTPTTLSLDAVLGAVEQHFPLVRAAERERDIADAELLAAEGGFDPTWRTRASAAPVGYYRPLTVDSAVTQPTQLWGAQLFAGWRLGDGLTYTGIPVYDGKLETNEFGELRAGVTVPLWRNGPIDRARANIRRAEQGRVVATMNAAQQRMESLRTGAVRYWEWVAAGRRLAITEELLALARTRDAALAERVTRGDLPQIERADNQRAIVQREGAVVLARRQLEQAAIELSLYARDAQGTPRVPSRAELIDRLPEAHALDAVCVSRETQEALTRRPEPRRLEAQREQQRVERDWAENQQRPAIDVSVAASQDLGRGPQNREGPVLEAGVMIEIPLRNRVAIGRARAAEAAITRAEEQRRLALDRVLADVRDATSALDAARERVEVARRELTLARSIAEQERQRLILGDGSLLFVNLREVAVAEAAVREVDALLDWQRAAAAYRFAIAVPQRSPLRCVQPG